MTTSVGEFRGLDYQLPQFAELLALIPDEAGTEGARVELLRWRGVGPGFEPPRLVGWGPTELYGPDHVGYLYHLLSQSFDRDICPALRRFKGAVGIEFEITVAPSLCVVISSSAGVRRLFAASWRPGANGYLPARPTPHSRLMKAMRYQVARSEEQEEE